MSEKSITENLSEVVVKVIKALSSVIGNGKPVLGQSTQDKEYMLKSLENGNTDIILFNIEINSGQQYELRQAFKELDENKKAKETFAAILKNVLAYDAENTESHIQAISQHLENENDAQQRITALRELSSSDDNTVEKAIQETSTLFNADKQTIRTRTSTDSQFDDSTYVEGSNYSSNIAEAKVTSGKLDKEQTRKTRREKQKEWLFVFTVVLAVVVLAIPLVVLAIVAAPFVGVAQLAKRFKAWRKERAIAKEERAATKAHAIQTLAQTLVFEPSKEVERAKEVEDVLVEMYGEANKLVEQLELEAVISLSGPEIQDFTEIVALVANAAVNEALPKQNEDTKALKAHILTEVVIQVLKEVPEDTKRILTDRTGRHDEEKELMTENLKSKLEENLKSTLKNPLNIIRTGTPIQAKEIDLSILALTRGTTAVKIQGERPSQNRPSGSQNRMSF